MGNNSEYGRPILISIIGILNILFGVIALIVGVVMIMNIPEIIDALKEIIEEAGVTGDITPEQLSGFLGWGGVISGIISIIVGIGFWNGWAVFWYLTLICWALGFILNLLSIAATPISGIIGAVICAVLVYYLFRPAVKAHFGI